MNLVKYPTNPHSPYTKRIIDYSYNDNINNTNNANDIYYTDRPFNSNSPNTLKLNYSCNNLHTNNVISLPTSQQYLNEMQQRKHKFFQSKPPSIQTPYTLKRTPYNPYSLNTKINLTKHNSPHHLHNAKNGNSYDIASLRDISEVYCIKKEPTDITDDTIFDKHNNYNYHQYKALNREYSDYNKYLMDSVNSERKSSRLNRIIQEGNNNLQRRNLFNKMEMAAKLHASAKKKQYRDMLDEQRRGLVVNKLNSENFDIDSVNINPQYYKEVELSGGGSSYASSINDGGSSSSSNSNRMKSPDKSFINRNKFVEVNPFSKKDYYLGDTNMNYNTILHPRIDYKYNKYMFNNNSNNMNTINRNSSNTNTLKHTKSSPFTAVGYSIAH